MLKRRWKKRIRKVDYSIYNASSIILRTIGNIVRDLSCGRDVVLLYYPFLFSLSAIGYSTKPRALLPNYLGSSHTPRYLYYRTSKKMSRRVRRLVYSILNSVFYSLFGSLVDEGHALTAALRSYSYVLLECRSMYMIFTIYYTYVYI